MRKDGFPADMPVAIVVKHLLSVALPIALHDHIAQLAQQLYAMDGIAAHALELWGALTESEGNLLAREVGLAARGAIAAHMYGGTMLQ
jgi:hypothetical protein